MTAALLLRCVPGLAADLIQTCHIHPPAELVERGEASALVGPYPDTDACEAERLERFGDQGRCHCVVTFAPAHAGRPRSDQDRMRGPEMIGPGPALP